MCVMCSMCRRGRAHWTGQLSAGLHLQRGIVGPTPVNFLYTSHATSTRYESFRNDLLAKLYT
jgi:hypothetical protein